MPLFSNLSRLPHYALIALVSGLILFASGCGGQSSDTDPGTPVPDTPREVDTEGTPIRFFGSQGIRNRPGAADPEYQEYLLWKEWKEYQRYREYLKSQGREFGEIEQPVGDTEETDTESESDSQ